MKNKEVKGSVDFSELAKVIQNDLTENTSTNESCIEEGDRFCRVCGYQYDLEYFPWRKIEGQWFPSYDLCVCCNVQFGYEDVTIFSVREYREKWITGGANFNYKNLMPQNWGYKNQLNNIRNEWR